MIGILLALVMAEKVDCRDPQTNADMIECTVKEYRLADRELNQQWVRAVGAAKAADLDLDRTRDKRPGYEATLRAAQRSWIAFRDQHCQGEGYVMRGGSGEPLMITSCKLELTKERTRQLKDLTENY